MWVKRRMFRWHITGFAAQKIYTTLSESDRYRNLKDFYQFLFYDKKKKISYYDFMLDYEENVPDKVGLI